MKAQGLVRARAVLWRLHLVLAALCLVQGAELTRSPAPPSLPPRPAAIAPAAPNGTVLQRIVLRSKAPAPPGPKVLAPPARGEPVKPKATLIRERFELVATSVHSAPARSMCIYRWRGEDEQRIAYVGREIERAELRVIEVHHDHVILGDEHQTVQVFLREHFESR